MRSLLRHLSILVVVALLVAACSSGGGDEIERSDGETPRSSAPGAEGGPASSAPAGGDDVLRLGLAGPMSLDPAAMSPASVSSVILVDLLHDSLTRLDADGAPVPGLASFTTNEDRTVWRFELRENARFADGTAITADDVVASLQRIRAQGGASLAAIQLEDVREVTAVGPSTVDIAVASPTSELPTILSSPAYGILDRDVMPTTLDAPLNPSGVHRVEPTAPDRLVLHRQRGRGPDRIELRLFPDETRAYLAFTRGELDWSPIPIDRLGEALEASGDAGLVPFHATVLLGVNDSVAPLHKRRLRRAIALAIDRATLTDAVFGPTAQPLRGLIPARVRGAARECVAPCGADVVAARREIAEAFAGTPVGPLQLLTDESETHASIAGILQEQLGAAGLELTVRAVDAATYDEALRGGQQQLFLHSSLGVARTPATHLLPWATTSPDNLTGYGNELVDAAIALALAEPDHPTRTTRWQEVEAAVLGDVPVVPLSQLRTVAAISRRTQGLVVHVDGSIDVRDVTFTDGTGGG